MRKGEFRPRTTRPLSRTFILKMSSHPASTASWIVLLRDSLRVCVREGEQGKKGDDRTYVRAHAGRHNCERCSGERRRVTRVGSRRSLWSLAAGYAFVQQAFIQPLCYLCNRECVGIPASCSPRPCAPVKRFNTLCLLEGFARMSYPPRGDERLLVQFPSK